MKICYLCADLGIPVKGYKGASAHVRGLVQALSSLGHEVVVVSPNFAGDGDLGVPLVPVKVPAIAGAIAAAGDRRLSRALGHLWNNVGVEHTLEGLLENFRPDLVYERYSPFAVAGGLVARHAGVPHFLEVNAPLAWEGREYRRQALQEAAEFLETTVFGAASRIVAVSAELREALIAAGVPPARITVVPNGVDVDLFTPVGESFRASLADKLVIGFVGSLKPWHGIELLADAFRLLADDPRFHLLVVGSGPKAKEVERLARDLPGRVTQAGAVPHAEVPKFLRAMDIAVAPYPNLERFYFSPLKVLEYMAAARAIVATRIGQIADLVDQGRTGILVPPGDAAALAEAIRVLGADEAMRRALGEAAAERARSAHRWTDRALDILRVLNGANMSELAGREK